MIMAPDMLDSGDTDGMVVLIWSGRAWPVVICSHLANATMNFKAVTY